MVPLAHRMRPRSLDQFFGQTKLVGSDSLISASLRSRRLSNLLLWGPPGCGKTTLAFLLGQEFEAEFIASNAIDIGSKKLREIGEDARLRSQLEARQTIVFVDEIHRLNKAQQDVLLPSIEQGDFVLIGATTENPSYELNRALLSRCHLLVFDPLSSEELTQIWKNACRELGREPDWLEPDALKILIELSDGDARRFINFIEVLSNYSTDNSALKVLTLEMVKEVLPQQILAYDKAGDAHFDHISAFIKSVRGSDPDAALYYLAKMISSGEDPEFIARRLVILASEDIGNADPRALQIAISGADAVRLIGLPECAINLAQVVTYLASAPKSNRSYRAWLSAKEFVEKNGSQAIPLHLRSSRTAPMVKLGYGVDYKYPHDWPRGWVDQEYLPAMTNAPVFYEPSEHGFEKNIREYRAWQRGLQNKQQS